MNIHELHNAYIGTWPDRVRIDDGYSTGNGYMLPTLSRVHDAVEDGIDHKTDHWGNIFTWSMFQACHSHARGLRERGITEMVIAEVPLEEIDRWVASNLSGEDWADERAQYSALGSNNSLQARRP